VFSFGVVSSGILVAYPCFDCGIGADLYWLVKFWHALCLFLIKFLSLLKKINYDGFVRSIG
jgi:hypothetical protein